METVSDAAMGRKFRDKTRRKRSSRKKFRVVPTLAGLFLFLFVTTNSALQATEVKKAPVPDRMVACQVDNDCTYVETLCSSCCGYVGINKNFVKEFYDQDYTKVCAGYDGPVCDCVSPTTVPVCREGACGLSENEHQSIAPGKRKTETPIAAPQGLKKQP